MVWFGVGLWSGVVSLGLGCGVVLWCCDVMLGWGVVLGCVVVL